MSATPTLQLSLGPVLFYWTREHYANFYREAADWPVEIVHLGESVCSRRRDMKLDDWLGIGRELTQSGKQMRPVRLAAAVFHRRGYKIV